MKTLKDSLYDFVANIRNRHVSCNCIDDAARTKIFVFRHFRCTLPSVFDNKKFYHPLWCGQSCQLAAEGELCDNSGVNISKYNPYLNEMTGIFWVANHYAELGNPEYVGFNHYRRYLEWSPTLLAKGTIIATSVTIMQKVGDWLKRTLPNEHLQLALDKLLQSLESNDRTGFQQYLNSHCIYARNMFITDRETFFRYFSFMKQHINAFISEVDRNEATFSTAPSTHKRLYGYLLEQLTSYWIWQERHSRSSKVITTNVDDFDVKPV